MINDGPRDARRAVVVGPARIAQAVSDRLTSGGYLVGLGVTEFDNEFGSSSSSDQYEARSNDAILDLSSNDAIRKYVSSFDIVSLFVSVAEFDLAFPWVGRIDETRVQRLWERNVLGLLRLAEAVLPRMASAKDAQVITVNSAAGSHLDAWAQGQQNRSGITSLLRNQYATSCIRVTELLPARYEQAEHLSLESTLAQLQSVPMLTAGDIADSVLWVAERPPHVCIESMVIRATAQSTSFTVVGPKIPDGTSEKIRLPSEVS